MYSPGQEINKDKSSGQERAKERTFNDLGKKKVNDRSYKCNDQVKKVLKIEHIKPKTREMVS